jgi:hypothetical protein
LPVLIRLVRKPRKEKRPVNRAFNDIRAERQKVLETGYSRPHDDEHKNGEIAVAALCLLMGATRRDKAAGAIDDTSWYRRDVPSPKNSEQRRHMLVQAAQQIVAEIERIDRIECAPIGAEALSQEADLFAQVEPNDPVPFPDYASLSDLMADQDSSEIVEVVGYREAFRAFVARLPYEDETVYAVGGTREEVQAQIDECLAEGERLQAEMAADEARRQRAEGGA